MMQSIEKAVIFLSCLTVIIFYSELTLHNYGLYRKACKETDYDVARFVLNLAMMAGAAVFMAAWILFVVFVGGEGPAAQTISVGLLAIGSIGAVVICFRVRFRS